MNDQIQLSKYFGLKSRWAEQNNLNSMLSTRSYQLHGNHNIKIASRYLELYFINYKSEFQSKYRLLFWF